MGKKKYDAECKFCGASPIMFKGGRPHRCCTCGAMQFERSDKSRQKKSPPPQKQFR